MNLKLICMNSHTVSCMLSLDTITKSSCYHYIDLSGMDLSNKISNICSHGKPTTIWLQDLFTDSEIMMYPSDHELIHQKKAVNHWALYVAIFNVYTTLLYSNTLSRMEHHSIYNGSIFCINLYMMT